jgi:hypothetical protein
VKEVAAAADESGVPVVWYHKADNQRKEHYCQNCGFLLDVVAIGGQCIHCYLGETIITEDDAREDPIARYRPTRGPRKLAI